VQKDTPSQEPDVVAAEDNMTDDYDESGEEGSECASDATSTPPTSPAPTAAAAGTPTTPTPTISTVWPFDRSRGVASSTTFASPDPAKTAQLPPYERSSRLGPRKTITRLRSTRMFHRLPLLGEAERALVDLEEMRTVLTQVMDSNRIVEKRIAEINREVTHHERCAAREAKHILDLQTENVKLRGTIVNLGHDLESCKLSCAEEVIQQGRSQRARTAEKYRALQCLDGIMEMDDRERGILADTLPSTPMEWANTLSMVMLRQCSRAEIHAIAAFGGTLVDDSGSGGDCGMPAQTAPMEELMEPSDGGVIPPETPVIFAEKMGCNDGGDGCGGGHVANCAGHISFAISTALQCI